MSTTTSIFSFDHGQKKIHHAIGVTPEFIDDLQQQIGNVLKDHIFDENRDVKDDRCASQLVEAALHEFSYSQLVLIAGLYLQERLDGFAEMMEKKLKGVVKKIALDADDMPDDIRDFLINLAQNGLGDSKGSAINGDDLPQNIKDFLDNIARRSEDAGDDD
jgi:hypothetical protein